MIKNIQRNTLFILFIFFNFSSSAFASSPYKLNTQNELIYLGAGATMALTGYYNEQDRSAPTQAELSSLNKNNIPGFERGFAGRWNEDSHKLSDITLATGVLSPLTLLLINPESVTKDDFFTLGIMYLETFALTSGGMALSKGSVTRFRPLAYSDKAPLSERLKHDTKRSFFSGHAALSTSGFIFSASVFSDYFPNSKYRSIVWATAITGSVTTGLLRIDAGKHFPSDVAAGLVWGASIGYLIPYLHKSNIAKANKKTFLYPYIDKNHAGINIQKLF